MIGMVKMIRTLWILFAAVALAACGTPPAAQQGATPGATTATPSGAGLASSDKATAATALVEACIEGFRDPVADLLPALRQSGWAAVQYGGPDAYEIGSPTAGIGGYLSTNQGAGFCSIGELASLDAAKTLVDALVNRRFAQIAQPGRMEGRAGPCDGWVLFPGRGTITIAYDGLGNDPVCPDPDGAVIVISTSS